jgi:sugar phosphate isomerase/epimerase
MRDIVKKYGLEACSLGIWGWNHTSPDTAEREQALEHLERAIEFASMLEASVLVTGAGEIPGASADENAEAFAQTFAPYMAKIRETELKLAIYPLHGQSFVDGMDDYERIWEHYPEIGIKFDPANFSAHGDDYLAIARDYGERIYHVHIKEHIYMEGEVVSQPAAGMGDISWGKVIAFLYEHGYDGYLSVEPHGPIWGNRGPLHDTMLILTQRYISQFLL